jgi:two-component system cell cycle sensor histidine kinase/response regulator CckA
MNQINKESSNQTSIEYIDQLEDEVVALEIENHDLHQKIKTYEFDLYKLQKIQKLANVGTWELNHLTYKLTISEELSQLLCDKVTDLSDMSWHNFLDSILVKESEGIKKSLIENVIQKGENINFEHAMKRPDGLTIFVRHQCKTFYNSINQPLFTAGMIQDITLSKQAESSQKTLEKQLRQSQKMEALGTLSGGIAHDFNNILGVILGNAEMLVSVVGENIKGKKYLKSLNNASQRAANLVTQILTFSRMEPEKLEHVDLATVLQDSVSMLRKTISAHIEIQQEIDFSNNQIMGNETQLHQIIINLITNAVHSLGNEKGIIKVKLNIEKTQLKYVGYLRLRISDNGCGISKENLNKIFDPFFTTKDKGKGTGLGLAVIDGIVKTHGGKISVNSELGIGTTFIIYFPIKNEIIPNKSLPVKHKKNGTSNILLVDDEDELRNLIGDYLEDIGHKVIRANNGLEGFDFFKQNIELIDLVITDQSMPELTGTLMSKKINQLKSDMPIILMTGYSEDISINELKILGITKRLLKPLSLCSLSNTISEVIENT